MKIFNMIFIFFLCFCERSFSITEVNEESVLENGLTEETVTNWISKFPSIPQSANGELYYDFLSDKLYDEINDNGYIYKTPKNECLKIVDKKEEAGGTFTLGLFFGLVNSRCLDASLPDKFKLKFIVKALATGKSEIDNLEIVQSSEIGKLASSNDPGLPRLTFAEDFFKFTTDYLTIEDSYPVETQSLGYDRRRSFSPYVLNDKRGKSFSPRTNNNIGNSLTPDNVQEENNDVLPAEIYFSVIHSAKGQSLNDIFNKGTFDDVKKAFSALGRSIGKLHAKFIDKSTFLSKEGNIVDAINKLKEAKENIYDYYKTYTHGDLHWNNSFYDEVSDNIILIDNESFVVSLAENGASIINDLERIYNVPVLFWKSKDKCVGGDTVTETENTCKKLEIAYAAFFEVYKDQFPQSEKEFLSAYIAYFLNNHKSVKIYDTSDPNFYYGIEDYDSSEETKKFSTEILNKISPSDIVKNF